MSFSIWEVLEEFAEAAEFGREQAGESLGIGTRRAPVLTRELIVVPAYKLLTGEEKQRWLDKMAARRRRWVAAHRQQVLAAARARYTTKRLDPEWMARQRAKTKARYQRLKQDPVQYARLLKMKAAWQRGQRPRRLE